MSNGDNMYVMPDEHLVEVKGLKTHFFTDEGVVKAVDGVDFVVPTGKTLGIVGESGSGKSITARSIVKLVDRPGRIVSGQVLVRRRDNSIDDVVQLPQNGESIRRLRGREISMIFQEPMASLSPVHKIGKQITEMVELHMGLDKGAARERAIDMLRRVDMPKATQAFESYTFELSGGMRQRAMIAMALSCDPSLLIADEPTTALDVTTQATIVDLLMDLQEQMGMSVVFITHDLGVIAEIAESVVVMYLGNVVERGDVDSIFHDAKHPYTQALLTSIPKLGLEKQRRLSAIEGMVPHPFRRPRGCPFHNRCPQYMDGVCDQLIPPAETIGPGREVRCLLYSNVDEVRAAQVEREDFAAGIRQGEVSR